MTLYVTRSGIATDDRLRAVALAEFNRRAVSLAFPTWGNDRWTPPTPAAPALPQHARGL